MMDTVIQLLADELLDASAADGRSRAAVLTRLIEGGFEMASSIGERLNLPHPIPTSASDGETDVRALYRQAHLSFTAAAAHLSTLDEDEEIPYRGLNLRPGEIVPQRVAEVVLTHAALGSAWTIEEADPDSALDALDALVRRLRDVPEVPSLRLETEEGDLWEVGDEGQRIFGDRENLVQWLAWGEVGDLESDRPLPDLPTLPQWG